MNVITEIRKKKVDLEDNIGQLIARYETETQTRIEDIEIDRIGIEEHGEQPKDLLGKIKVMAVIL